MNLTADYPFIFLFLIDLCDIMFFSFSFFSQKEMVFCANLVQLFSIILGIEKKVQEKKV